MNNVIQALERKAILERKGYKMSFRHFIWFNFGVNPFTFDDMTDLKFKEMLIKEYENYIERDDLINE